MISSLDVARHTSSAPEVADISSAPEYRPSRWGVSFRRLDDELGSGYGQIAVSVDDRRYAEAAPGFVEEPTVTRAVSASSGKVI